MAFRSHLFRGLDLNLASNRRILFLTALTGLAGAGLAVFYQRSAWLAVEGGGVVFLSWALTRELDPDRANSALLTAVLAGTWALTGQMIALLPAIALLAVGRLLVESTGRRPLVTDALALAAFGAAISFTPLGFVAGFGISVAMYLDEMLAREHRLHIVLAAAGGALGSTLVATLSGAFDLAPARLHPLTVALFVALTLTAARVPPVPTSQVDSRRKSFMRQDRVQASRMTVGLLMVAGGLIGGTAAAGLVPVAAALGVALGSSEVERLTRNRL